MLSELNSQVANGKLLDPRNRKFLTEKKSLKQLMNGELWADQKQQRDSGRRGIRCIVSSRYLESSEEYEEHLDRLFQREILQKKNPR